MLFKGEFMSMIINFIMSYGDQILICFSAGGIGYFTAPILKAKLKKDGPQLSDIPEAVCEGVAEYQAAMTEMYTVAKDVTVNDKDTVNFVINMIDKFKTFK